MNTNTNNNPVNPKPARSSLGVADKLNQILDAWEDLAPEAKFAEMSLADFRVATAQTLETRRALGGNRNRISSLVSDQLAQETALGATLKRVSAAVVLDRNFGAESPLYRAMGYVTALERKSPSPKVASPETAAEASSGSSGAVPDRATNAKGGRYKYVLERFEDMVSAWEDTEVVSIGGLKLEDWQPAGEALRNTRLGLAGARIERRSLVGAKKAADVKTLALIRKVVASVVASSGYGENSALYRTMGYIPKNERKSPNGRPVKTGAI